MSEWTKVVTDPLGLVAFALFLVFGLLAKIKQRKERRWLSAAAGVMAVAALASGLVLAYLRIQKESSTDSPQAHQPPATSMQQTNQQVQQTTTGPCRPAVQGVQGEVSITIDQSCGNTESQKAGAKKPEQRKPEQNK